MSNILSTTVAENKKLFHFDDDYTNRMVHIHFVVYCQNNLPCEVSDMSRSLANG